MKKKRINMKKYLIEYMNKDNITLEFEIIEHFSIKDAKEEARLKLEHMNSNIIKKVKVRKLHTK